MSGSGGSGGPGVDLPASLVGPVSGTLSAGEERELDRRLRVLLNLVTEPGSYAEMSLAHELGPAGFLRAIHDDPERHAIVATCAARLTALGGSPEAAVDAALRAAERCGARFVVPGDVEWPRQLDALADQLGLDRRGGVPIGLWARGPLRLDQLAESVAVVGSRSSTTYGDETTGDLAARLGSAGIPVVSGAAYGIDYAAHRGAVSVDAATVAVLACGVDRAYPQAHREMIEYLAQDHLVLSEAPIGAQPHRIRFLARNRLIAAISRGTVVVEAAARSGALHTLRWAERLSRVAMAVPGPVTSAASVGCHDAIRNGVASLVTCGDEVLELIGRSGEHLTGPRRGAETARDRLSLHDRQVLDAVPVATPAAAASIAGVAGVDPAGVGEALDTLLAAELVVRDDRGWRLAAQALR